jgi:hypothetical protein
MPLMQEVTASRGGKAKFDLRIRNRGDKPLDLSMYVHEFNVSEEGIPSTEPGGGLNTCRDWLALSPQNFSLQPDSSQLVQGILTVPKTAQGGYYAFITCNLAGGNEPSLDLGSPQQKLELDIARSVSTTLLVTVKSSENTIELKPDSLRLLSGRTKATGPLDSPDTGNNSHWQVVLPVTNYGNLHAKADGMVSIWSTDARLVDRAALRAGKGFVLPGKTRIFRAEGIKALPDGEYMVKVQLRPEQRTNRVTEGAFAYSVVNGEAVSGASTDELRKLMDASSIPFTLSKSLADVKINPGANRTQGLNIINRSDDTLQVYSRIATWGIDDSGRVQIDPDSALVVNPCTSWVKVWPNPVMLAPRQSGTAKITVTAPEGIEGEYFAAAVFETPQTPQNLPSELQLPRTVLIPVASSQNVRTRASLEVLGYKEVSPLMRTFVISVLNQGNVHCFADGDLTVFDAKWNIIIDKVPFGGAGDYVMPQKSRNYVVAVPGALDPGKYSAVIQLKYNETAPAASTEYFFNSEKR